MVSGCLKHQLIPSEDENRVCYSEVNFSALGTGPYECYFLRHETLSLRLVGLAHFGDRHSSLPYSGDESRRQGFIELLGCTGACLKAYRYLMGHQAYPCFDSNLHIGTKADYCSSPSGQHSEGCFGSQCACHRYRMGFLLAFWLRYLSEVCQCLALERGCRVAICHHSKDYPLHTQNASSHF